MPTDDTDLFIYLLTRLDQLLAALEDEPALHAGLLRERARLLSLGLAQDGPPWLRALPLLRPSEAPDRERGADRLRAVAYRALFAGIIDGRAFDAVMLLATRARARAGRGYVGSPSASLSRITPSGPSGPSCPSAGPGCGGGAPSAPASARRKRSRLSTIRTCA